MPGAHVQQLPGGGAWRHILLVPVQCVLLGLSYLTFALSCYLHFALRPPQWGWVVARLWLFMTLRVLYVVTAHSACIGVRWPWLRTWCAFCILWHVCIVYIYIYTFLDMHLTCMHIVHICLYTHNSHTFLNEERSHTHIYIYIVILIIYIYYI